MTYEVLSDSRTIVKKETINEVRETRFTMAEKLKQLEDARAKVASLEAEIAEIRTGIGEVNL